jgi:short-subunit dehydrogenase involved in D-alanine esterification of teichoic acids
MVFEVIPPSVDIKLVRETHERRIHEYSGIPPLEVAEVTLTGLVQDEFEIAIGQAQHLHAGTRQEAD